MEQTITRPAMEPATQTASVAGAGLRVDGITKRFGAFTALDNVTLEVESGKLVCFLGPSGCGKTTLLRVIAGLEPQDAGRVVIGGRDVSRLPPALRDFGIVFQSYALFPNLTVAQNVGYGLFNRGKSRAQIKTRVDELLVLVGLLDQAAKYPVQLSGGQQQRVALARALASSPSLLLLDEPLSALDARVRARLRDEIKTLQRRVGVTTVLVTHDQEEALTMADRIAVMNNGRVEQVGSPLEIYARPRSSFVANFVGTMNLFDATVAGHGIVEVGALKLACDASDQWSKGQRVRLGLRPEEVRIRAVDPGAPNAIIADVEFLDFLGPFCRAILRPQGAPHLSLSCDFSANAMRDLGIREGQALTVVLPSESLRIFEHGA